MDFVHEWTNCVQVDNDKYFSKSRLWYWGTSCHAMRPDIDCDVADFDFATWVRPVSGSDQGQFVRTRMNEPYLLDTAI